MPAKLTTEQWIVNAVAKHGDRYDYSKSVYRTAKTKITITCRLHGDFEQTPDSHARGNGCPKCKAETLSRLKQKDTFQFIDSAKNTHGDLYDYHKVKYATAHGKVEIICPLHGSFMQSATNHLSGAGCPKCGRARTVEASTIDKQSFIERAVAIHGGAYNYSRTSVNGMLKKSLITCKLHGDFYQTPASHLGGAGCPACANERVAEAKTGSLEGFIEKATLVHGERYDYSRVVYISQKDKIEIVCPEHGPFFQTPNDHQSGKGCAACAGYGFRSDIPAVFYYARINRAKDSPLWMVGITNRTFEDRYPRSDREKMTLLHLERFDLGLEALEQETQILRANKELLFTGRSPLKSKGIKSGLSREIFVSDILGLDAVDSTCWS